MPSDQDAADIDLVRAIAAGDGRALETLYARHGLYLLNTLLGILNDRASAEEVLQTVMVAVWESAGQFRGDSAVKTWLVGIARNQAFKRLRGQRPQTPIEDVTLASKQRVGAEVEARLRADALNEAITELPHDQQVALELVFYRGLKIAEAAAQVDTNENTMKSRLRRAKANLRRILIAKEMHDA